MADAVSVSLYSTCSSRKSFCAKRLLYILSKPHPAQSPAIVDAKEYSLNQLKRNTPQVISHCLQAVTMTLASVLRRSTTTTTTKSREVARKDNQKPACLPPTPEIMIFSSSPHCFVPPDAQSGVTKHRLVDTLLHNLAQMTATS